MNVDMVHKKVGSLPSAKIFDYRLSSVTKGALVFAAPGALFFYPKK
jgi:hypothetical protein